MPPALQAASAKLAPWGLFLQLSVNVGVGIVDRYKIRYENLSLCARKYIKAIRVNKLQYLWALLPVTSIIEPHKYTVTLLTFRFEYLNRGAHDSRVPCEILMGLGKLCIVGPILEILVIMYFFCYDIIILCRFYDEINRNIMLMFIGLSIH